MEYRTIDVERLNVAALKAALITASNTEALTLNVTKAPGETRCRRKEEDPGGTYKKYRFEETRLGFMLKHEVPVVFDIIMNMIPYAPVK